MRGGERRDEVRGERREGKVRGGERREEGEKVRGEERWEKS